MARKTEETIESQEVETATPAETETAAPATSKISFGGKGKDEPTEEAPVPSEDAGFTRAREHGIGGGSYVSLGAGRRVWVPADMTPAQVIAQQG